jgi:trigger factor
VDSNLNIVREEPAPCHIKLSVEVPVETVQAAFKDIEKQFRKNARIPGFRPGKAPRTLLVGHYGERIREEVISKLVRDSANAAIKQEDLTPETQPHIDNEENLAVEEDAPFVFACEFDVAPEFELPDYKSLELPEASADIEDDAVENVVQEILQSRTSYETVERAAEAGDLLQGSYKAKQADSLDVPETAKFLLNGDNTWVALREPEILPGITEVMVGVETGETREFTINFPDDFYEGSLAGKSLEYSMQVTEVQAPQTPELTDDLAKELGAESADDVKGRIRQNLEMREQQQAAQKQREQAVQALADQVEFDLPPNILARRTYDTLSQLYQNRMSQGQSQEELGGKIEEMRADAERLAKESLKRSYILRKIADEEDVQVGMEEINRVIQQMSMYHRQPPKKLMRQLQENGRIMDLIEDVRENKTIARLLEINGKAE